MKKTTVFSRAVKRGAALLMALAMAFLIAGPVSPVVSTAYAATTGHGVFDMVGNDGQVVDGGGNVSTGGNTAETTKTLMTKGREIGVAISGVGTIIMLIATIIQLVKFGMAGDNDMSRKRAIGGILTTGIATALLGSVSIVVGFFWNALKG